MSDMSAMPAATLTRWQRVGPALTLLLLAPVIGEVMSGATLLSTMFALLPEIMVWGGGALLIRETVRRWRGGWASALLLGLALAVAEEFLIQQTSIAPLPWLAANAIYGRAWGVNWPYFLFQLVYEAVWVVLVPVQVTELLFPHRRAEPWLRTRGLLVSSLVFLLGSLVAWFLWTQRARPLVFHVPIYQPPIAALVSAVVAIVLLTALARAVRARRPSPSAARPRPWLVGLAALVLGLPWYGLLVVVFGRSMGLPPWIPMVVGSAWALAAYAIVRRWASGAGWSDMHRWSLSLGALLTGMLGGFLGAGGWSRSDTVAKAIMNALAVAGMIALGLRIARRSTAG
jgi:hypothetical protein